MCGIAGILAERGLAPGLVERILDPIAHRGPDDHGTWSDEAAGFGLGHRRLAIIDLSPAGHQPMHSASGRYVITFNGEIYNHQAIREELTAAGRAPSWRGHSDTETLLAAIATWGLVATLKRVAGMYALALWDRETRVLQLARDRAGEKPLYYGWVNGAFVFGSELKALRAYPGFSNPVNRGALDLLLRSSAVPAPFSIYEDICKLDPASVLTLSMGGARERRYTVEEYWSFRQAAHSGCEHPFSDEAEALGSLEAALRRAVSLQS